MDKKKIFILIAVVIVIFTFFNPFGSLNDLKNQVPKPNVPAEQAQSVSDYLAAHYQSPEDFVLDAFKEHDIVFLGEFWKIKQNLTFVSNLIPLLYAKGITNLGIEFALYQDQKIIDDLVTEKIYNAHWADDLLFNYLVIWGYKEYADLFKAVWEFNRTLGADKPPFRLVGLSVKQNYKYMTQIEDADNTEVIKKVYANGVPDVFMADVIKKEFIAKGKKALIYTHMHTGFTRFKYQEYAEKMQKLGFAETKKAGQIIYDAIGSRVMNVLIHAPFPSEKNYVGLDYAAKGVLDAAIAKLPEQTWRMGFYTDQPPISGLAIDSKVYAKGYETLTLRDFCDAYVILSPVREQQPVTPIPEFVNEKNLAAAIENFVAAKGKTLKTDDFNKYIQEDIDSLKKAIALFK